MDEHEQGKSRGWLVRVEWPSFQNSAVYLIGEDGEGGLPCPSVGEAFDQFVEWCDHSGYIFGGLSQQVIRVGHRWIFIDLQGNLCSATAVFVEGLGED